MTDLKDQTVVITGASSGIGKAIAVGCAERGSSLCLIGRNTEPLEKIIASGVQPSICRIYKANLASDKDIFQAVERIRSDFDQIDIIVHSAGDFSTGLIKSSSVEDFDRLYRINVRAPFLLTQLMLPMMRPQFGQIVFINSSVGLKSAAEVGHYAASKHALRAIADSLREEVNADGIRVLSVFPGRTATRMQAAVCEMEGRPYQPERLLQPEDVAAVVMNALVLPRTAEVTNIHIRPLIKSDY